MKMPNCLIVSLTFYYSLLLFSCGNKNEPVVESGIKKDTTILTTVIPSQSIYQLEGIWRTQDDRTISLSALRGKVQVIAMVFTHCRYACPRIVADMQQIEKGLPQQLMSKVGFTLVTFDTERDTVAMLKKFAIEKGLDSNWTLLHGSEEEIRELSMLLNVNYERLSNGDYSHTSIISILNKDGVIIYRHEGLVMDSVEMINKIIAIIK